MADDQRHLWDQEAATFDDEADHGLKDPAVRTAWARTLLPAVGDPEQLVVDLGCGTGSLTVLLAAGGHRVHGVDSSVELLRVARMKCEAASVTPTLIAADVSAPPLRAATYDVVLSRHVLWAMPDPSTALAHWVRLLKPGGRLVLVEGRWSTGAGLTAQDCAELVLRHREEAIVDVLNDPILWGGPISDERYLVLSRR